MSIPRPVEVKVGADVVGVYEYGDRGGRPLFALHGTPACGAGFEFADQAAKDRNIRLLAPDRPGVGLSTTGSIAVAVGTYPTRLAEPGPPRAGRQRRPDP